MKQVLEVLNLSARHASQVSASFLLGMASRMAMSFEKYGDVKDAYPHKLDAVGSLMVRLYRYLGRERFNAAVEVAGGFAAKDNNDTHRRDHGNTEYLMDVANFAMIEFMFPRLAGAHFKAEDSSASPGRLHSTGEISSNANTSSHENIRRGGTRGTTAGGFYKREGD